MDKYFLDLRHRPSLNESIQDKHDKFMQVMSQIQEPWGYYNKPTPELIINNSDLVSVVELNELSKRGCKSYITYKLRNEKYLRDDSQYDDTVIIEFKPASNDLQSFVEDVFPKYILGFECYRSSVINRTVTRADWPSIVEQTNSTGKNIDGRDGVYRINEINYYDRELCARTFNLSPEEIVELLEGKVENVSVFHDGVLLIYSTKLLSQDSLKDIDAKIKNILKK